MCLAIPYKIKKIIKQTAFVDSYDKKEKKIRLGLRDKVSKGDWVLVLNNYAVEKIPEREAVQIINMYKNYE